MERQAVPFPRTSIAQETVQRTNSQFKEKSKRSQGSKPLISEEEAKIRAELETDIEKDLEEELKSEMNRLALRLHRLYQHQKEADNKETTKTKKAFNYKQPITKKRNKSNNNEGKGKEKEKGVLEISISVSMDGEPKVNMKENKTPHRIVPLHTTKKFDWTTSLRSGPPKPSLQVVRNKVQRGKQDLRFLGRSKSHNLVPTG